MKNHPSKALNEIQKEKSTMHNNFNLANEESAKIKTIRLGLQNLETEFDSTFNALDRLRTKKTLDKATELIILQHCQDLKVDKCFLEQQLSTLRFQVIQAQKLQIGDIIIYQPQKFQNINLCSEECYSIAYKHQKGRKSKIGGNNQMPETDRDRYAYMLAYEGKSAKLLGITPSHKYYLAIDDVRTCFYTVEPWDIVKNTKVRE